MASSKEVIELLFNAEYAGKAEVRALKRDLNDLASDFQSGVSTVSAYTVAMAGIEAAAIAASVGLAKAGVAAAEEFNAGFAEISTLIDANGEDLSRFKGQLDDYATNTTQNLQTVNNAVYNAISAGIDYTNSLDFVRQAEQLAVAGKADLNDVVRLLAGTISAYGLEASDAGKLSDQFFSTVKNGVTTLPELANGFGQVSGLTASFGISIESVLGAVASLTKSGVDTSQAFTSIKAAITNIVKPSKDAIDTSKKLGISLGTQALESKGLIGVLNEMAQKTGGSTEQMSKLFGSTEALNAVLALTSKNGLKNFNEDTKKIAESVGIASESFAKMENNADLVDQKLTNAFNGFLRSIGGPLTDEFDKFDQTLIQIFKTLRDNVNQENGAFVPLIDSIEGVADTVSKIISNVSNNLDDALNMADLSGFSNAFDSINDAIKGLDIESPEGLAKAIEMIGNAFDGLTSFTISAGEVLKGMIEVFTDIAGYLKDLDDDWASWLGTVGGTALVISAATSVLSPFVTVLLSLKKIGGLPGAFGDASKIAATGSVLSGLAKTAGVVGAAIGSWELGKWIGAESGFFGKTITEIENTTIAGKELTQMLQEYRVSSNNASATMEDLAEHLREKNKALDESSSVYEKDKAEAEAWFKANENLATILPTVYTEEEKRRGAIVASAIATDEATGKLIKNEAALAELRAGNLDAAEAILAVGQAYESTSRKAGEAGKMFDATVAKAMKDLLTLNSLTTEDVAGLSSNEINELIYKVERKKTELQEIISKGMGKTVDGVKSQTNALKSAADILKKGVNDIKGLDAFFGFQSEKAKAAQAQFTALGDSAKSTGDAIAAAFGQSYDLDTFEGVFAQNEKERQIDEMIEQNGKLTDAQAELAKAKAKMIQQQTQSLVSGDALISIDGTNLEPQLEAFMFEILKSIQMRVSAEQADFLLGLK